MAARRVRGNERRERVRGVGKRVTGRPASAYRDEVVLSDGESASLVSIITVIGAAGMIVGDQLDSRCRLRYAITFSSGPAPRSSIGSAVRPRNRMPRGRTEARRLPQVRRRRASVRLGRRLRVVRPLRAVRFDDESTRPRPLRTSPRASRRPSSPKGRRTPPLVSRGSGTLTESAHPVPPGTG